MIALHSARPPQTSAEDRVPLLQKILYGAGNYATLLSKQAPTQVSFQIYNVALGVNPAWIGTVLGLTRLWDAVTDPFMGNLSDRWESRWGRRRPFIFIGAILTGICCTALWWMPRGLSEIGYIAYFTVLALIFYTALTVYSVPWYALGYELSPDYHERTRVQAFSSFFGPLANISVGWLYALTQLDYWTDTVEGARWVGLGVGVVITAFGIATAVVVKERAPHKKANCREHKLINSVKETFSNRPFVLLVGTMTLLLFGMFSVMGLTFYINVYYIFDGDTQPASVYLGWGQTVQYVAALLFIPIVMKASSRFEKKRVFITCILIAALMSSLKWVLFNPSYPWLQLIYFVGLGPANTAIFMLCQSMVADTCDYDELTSNSRREGLYGAVYAWVFKVGLAVAFTMTGWMLVSSGFDQALGGDQSEHTLVLMRLLFTTVPAFAFVGGAVLFWRYPLTEQRCHAIRSQLEATRGAVNLVKCK